MLYNIWQNIYQTFGTNRPAEKTIEKKPTMDMGTGTRDGFQSNKTNVNRRSMFSTLCERQRQLGDNRCEQTGLGITLWQKEDDGNIKPIAYGSRYLNDTEKNYSIGELELLAVVWGLEKFRFQLYGKKVYLYTDHQALEPLIKRNRCNKQYSARLTR